jgi:hypothetical protein
MTGGHAAAVNHGFTSRAKEVMSFPCSTRGCYVIVSLAFRDTEGLPTILIQNFTLSTILLSHSPPISIKNWNQFRPLQHRPVEPVGPVKPVAPVEPVAPVAPVEPVEHRNGDVIVMEAGQ